MLVNFTKMEGAGNDFILIDNRQAQIANSRKRPIAINYCRRALGIGADGVIFIENDHEFDFAWDFYNSDGSQAEMCGNGARCAARFAHKTGIAKTSMTFRTRAGPIEAQLTDRGAKVHLPNADLPNKSTTINQDDQDIALWFLNTGVPHAVIEVSDLEKIKVKDLGRAIRYHEYFAPAGTNVNFFRPGLDNSLEIRTYERGVEDETLACGTGSVATSIVAVTSFGKTSPITVKTRGGDELIVHLSIENGQATDVFLEGGARTVFTGSFED